MDSSQPRKSSNAHSNESLFLRRVYQKGISPYTSRLLTLGFSNKTRVLDAGCGYGQWSLALARLNKNVDACDISQKRVAFVSRMASDLNIDNLAVRQCALHKLPYKDASFDAIFCYGVIFLTPWKQSLRELVRVLRRGGILYVNANGVGWYNFLWKTEHNKSPDYDPKSIAARAFTDTLRYDRYGAFENGMNLIMDPLTLRNELKALGCRNIKTAGEGKLKFARNTAKEEPFFRSKYFGQTGVFEAVGTKC